MKLESVYIFGWQKSLRIKFNDCVLYMN